MDPKEVTVGARYFWSRHRRVSVVEVVGGPHRLPSEDDLDTIPAPLKGTRWGFRVLLLDEELRSMIACADELTLLPSQRR